MALRRGLPPRRRPLDVIVVIFLLINIPVILFLEAQTVLPGWVFPKFLQGLAKWHVRANGDFFMRDMPAYFKGVVFADLLFRLPLLILNAKAFYYGRDWGRLTGILYGVHSTTSLVPLLSEIYLSHSAKKSRLLMVYLPHLAVSLYVLLRVLPVAHPFSTPYPWRKAGGRRI